MVQNARRPPHATPRSRRLPVSKRPDVADHTRIHDGPRRGVLAGRSNRPDSTPARAIRTTLTEMFVAFVVLPCIAAMSVLIFDTSSSPPHVRYLELMRAGMGVLAPGITRIASYAALGEASGNNPVTLPVANLGRPKCRLGALELCIDGRPLHESTR